MAFAIGGGAVSGPAGAMALGGLGSGVLQFIADRIDAQVNTLGLPTEPAALKDYLTTVYIMSTYMLLDAETRSSITKEIEARTVKGVKPKLTVVSGMLRIANIAEMNNEDVAVVLSAIRRGSYLDVRISQSLEGKAIATFGRAVESMVKQTRRGV